MRIGISIKSMHRVDDPAIGARYMIERARTARQADLDTLFVGDHHVTQQPYYQNSPMLGRMLAEWHNKPAGALYLLPLWHPVLLAEQIATLAAIMDGRFILQCGLGGEPAQSAGMGVEMANRVAMFEDSLSVMQRLWQGETVSHNRFWPLDNACISPTPAQPVEVWVGASVPKAIRRAARLGDGWLAVPSLDFQRAGEQLDQYRQACAEFNLAPRAVAIRRDIFVGETSQQAGVVKAQALARGYRGFPEEALCCGSPAEVADHFGMLGDLGYTDVIVRNIIADQSDALATIERLAEVRAML